MIDRSGQLEKQGLAFAKDRKASLKRRRHTELLGCVSAGKRQEKDLVLENTIANKCITAKLKK